MSEDLSYIGNIIVGQRITEKLKEIGMTKAELSRALNMNQSNLNKLLKKDSIETSKLVVISRVMKYNFFKEFCRSFEYVVEQLSNEEFYITEVNVGELVEKRIKELGLTQQQVAEKVMAIQSETKDLMYSLSPDPKPEDTVFKQQYVSVVTKRTSADTKMLYYISRALNYNFFEDFYRKEETKPQPSKKNVPWELIVKGQQLSIENADLKHKVNVLRHILRTMAAQEDKLKGLGISDEDLREADIYSEDYDVYADDFFTSYMRSSDGIKDVLK